jgi:putative flippase GtrA
MGIDPGDGGAAPRRGAGMLESWRHWLPLFIAQTVRYGAVGVCVASLYTALVILFVNRLGNGEPDLAALCAFAIALPFSYLGHWAITFQRRHRFSANWQRFAVLNAISFTVAVPGMHLVTHVLGWSYYVGIAFSWFLAPLINYTVLQLWVFSHRRAS